MAEDNYMFQRNIEAERLRRQGRLAETITGPLLEKIGIRSGMSCLDIGCGPGEAMRLIAADADEVVCLASPRQFGSVGTFYGSFAQVMDDDVMGLLRELRGEGA